jgi:hypothetical protein
LDIISADRESISEEMFLSEDWIKILCFAFDSYVKPVAKSVKIKSEIMELNIAFIIVNFKLNNKYFPHRGEEVKILKQWDLT